MTRFQKKSLDILGHDGELAIYRGLAGDATSFLMLRPSTSIPHPRRLPAWNVNMR